MPSKQVIVLALTEQQLQTTQETSIFGQILL